TCATSAPHTSLTAPRPHCASTTNRCTSMKNQRLGHCSTTKKYSFVLFNCLLGMTARVTAVLNLTYAFRCTKITPAKYNFFDVHQYKWSNMNKTHRLRI